MFKISNSQKLIKGIVDYIVPSYETINNKKDNLELIPVKQKGLGSLVEIKDTYFVEAGVYKRVFALTDFFGDYMQSDFFSDCLSQNIKISITFKYQVTDKIKSKKKLQETINDLEKSTNGEFSNSITATLSRDKIEDMQETIAEAKELINTNKLIDFIFLVTLSAPDYDTLTIQTNIIQQIAEGNGFVITPVVYKQKEAITETVNPSSINLAIKPYKRKLLEYNIAPLVPIRNDIRAVDTNNIWIGRTKESKQFLTVPIQTSSNLNTHTIILGTTGYGKSTLLKTVVLQAVLKGMHIVAIDPQGELNQMATLLKGEVKKCGYNQSFRLLNGNLNEEDKEVYIRLLTSYFVKCNGEESMRSYYSSCLYELLENKEPTLQQFKELITKKDKENGLNNRLIDSMAVVFRGKLGQMLSGNQDIDITNPFTVFDFSELQSQDHNDEFKSMFLSLFTFVISKSMHERNKKTVFILDEAYQVLDDETSRDFILKTVKKIRKMNSSVLISMQTLTDYGETGKNLWSLCNYKFLFRHENTDYLVNHLDIGEIEKINDFMMGEYMFISENKKVVATTIDPELTPNIKPFITFESR